MLRGHEYAYNIPRGDWAPTKVLTTFQARYSLMNASCIDSYDLLQLNLYRCEAPLGYKGTSFNRMMSLTGFTSTILFVFTWLDERI